MIAKEAIPNLLGNTAYDVSHDKIGKIGHVYVDDRTGQPEWMTVQTGQFGSRETFIPLEPAQLHGNEVEVHVVIDYGANIPTVAAEVQRNVADYLERMTDVRPAAVHVIVDDVVRL